MIDWIKGLTPTHWLWIIAPIVALVMTSIAHSFGWPTVSTVGKTWGRTVNTIPFLGGCLIGHYWAPLTNPITNAFGYALPFLAAYVIYDLVWNLSGQIVDTPWERAVRYPLFPVVIGTVVGALFWAQHASDGITLLPRWPFLRF